MNPCTNLFDLEPFSEKAPRLSPGRRRKPLNMSPNVWLALVSLKATLDAVPEAELDQREKTYRKTVTARTR